jgi:ABC-2 type transport system ATP-binding protein
MTSTAASSPPALSICGLSKSYAGRRIVGPLDFSLPAGSVTGLLGGNGAGKTTTIGMIMGLIEPTEGMIRVFGHDMALARYEALGRIFGLLYDVVDLESKIESLADELALRDFLDRPTGRLSAGQKTRASIAKALLNDPQLLLLDEPTASLDPDTADWVRTRLETHRHQHNCAILLASHNMAEVERLCDRVLMLKNGVIVDDAAPAALIARYGRATLEEVFLDIARSAGEPVAL